MVSMVKHITSLMSARRKQNGFGTINVAGEKLHNRIEKGLQSMKNLYWPI